MNKIIYFLLLLFLEESAFAQKQTFDLITFTPPKGWTKNVEETLLSYTITDQKTKSWCRINIVKSTISKGDIDQDFEYEWQELVVKNYQPAGAPQLMDANNPEGWKVKAGLSKFIYNNSDAKVYLITATGYNRCASIVAVTNSDQFINDIDTFFATVELIKQEEGLAKSNISNIEPAAPNTINGNQSILGTWCISSSDNSSYRVKNGVMSTIFRQYTFSENNTYTCYIKTYDPLMNSTFLGRESGTYQISESNLTIIPQKSVLEEWSKINNTDQWGKLLKSQKIALEKVTYSFTKLYIPENNEWQLILKAGQTKRDGHFNNYERNAWVYIISSPARPVIKLPQK